MNGKRTNYDIYDHLTFIMYVEVEVRPEPGMIKPLLDVNARVVVPLSSGLDLSKFAEKKRLLIGKITPRYKGSLEDVHDIYLDGESESLVKEMIKSGKRVIVNKGQNKGVENVFGRIYEPDL